MTILAQHVVRYGFAGIDGLIGVFVGLFIFVVVVAILFKIFNLLMAALGVPNPWAGILYWFAVLILFLAFLHFFGLY